jgi:hypothetical protein
MRLVPLDRTMELPLTLAGGLQTSFAEAVLAPASGAAGGAHAPITCRSQRALRGGARQWGECNKKSRAYLIVEDDAEVRGVAAALLEDEQLDTATVQHLTPHPDQGVHATRVRAAVIGPFCRRAAPPPPAAAAGSPTCRCLRSVRRLARIAHRDGRGLPVRRWMPIYRNAAA